MWISVKNSIRYLKRNKLFSFLNILGLTIGISSCWVIYRYVSYELSYEKGVENQENVYRVLSNFKMDGAYQAFGGLSKPIFFYMRNEMSLGNGVIPSFKMHISKIEVPAINGRETKREQPDYNETNVIRTTPSYFNLLPYKWVAGNKATSLNDPSQLVLTQKRAKHYFPNLSTSEIMGKTIVYNDSVRKTISGIVTDLDFPTEFKGDEFILLQETEDDKRLVSWTNSNSSDKVYISTKDRISAEKILAQLQAKTKSQSEIFKAEVKPTYEYSRTISILPLSESHFATHINEANSEKTSKNVIYGLIGVGIFLLLLACINYINLTTAQLPQRNKEIGIRKTLGSSRRSLILQMMMETLMIVCFAAVLSAVVSHFALSILGDLISDNIKAYSNPILFVLFLLGILSVTVLLAGVYPSWIISKVNAIDIFRNKGVITVGGNKLLLRKTLIIFQFIIAQIFIVGALIIGQQLKFLVETDMGFNKDAVILTEIPYKLMDDEHYQTKKKTLAHEIRQIPGVKALTMGDPPLSQSSNSSAMEYYPKGASEPIVPILYGKTIDKEYLKFYNIQLLAGRLPIESDTTNGFLINQTAAAIYGFKDPNDAIGEIIGQKGYMHPIIGVVKDFHTQDFYTAIQPMALSYNAENLDSYEFRLDPVRREQWPQILNEIKTTWSKFFPTENFQYKFYDESILEMYKKEQHLFKLTNISTAITIIISCLGLFGLATITAFQRSKEIGIRKVLGASITGIIGMLSKDFVKMILLAILIASPIIWWACSKWLEDFEFRIEMSYLPFFLGGGLALIAALLTISFQAIKAAKTNPVESLRDE